MIGNTFNLNKKNNNISIKVTKHNIISIRDPKIIQIPLDNRMRNHKRKNKTMFFNRKKIKKIFYNRMC